MSRKFKRHPVKNIILGTTVCTSVFLLAFFAPEHRAQAHSMA